MATAKVRLPPQIVVRQLTPWLPGFPRLVVPPAVAPNSSHPTNNINVITLAYIPNGMNIHFQTPFGIGASPYVKYGTSAKDLKKTATGATNTFGRTPSCSAYSSVTQCSEYFHNVQIQNLTANTVYYYQIPGGNGTTASPVMHFKTAPEAGADSGEFSCRSYIPCTQSARKLITQVSQCSWSMTWASRMPAVLIPK